MTEPSVSSFRQAIGSDAVLRACALCGETDRAGCTPSLEPQPDGRVVCSVCSHVGLPIMKESADGS